MTSMLATAETIFPQRTIQYANFRKRMAALLIDFLIVMLMSMIISAHIPFPYNWIFSAWIYEATQVSGPYQATIGQRIVGIKVCNTRGGSLPFAEASLRHCCKYISLLIACWGYPLILLDKRKQCLHDKIVLSVVVTEESFQAAS